MVHLSTNFNLSKYSPFHKFFHSARYSTDPIKGDDLQPPFVELPFDTWQSVIVYENDIKLEDVSEAKYMVKFGRPL